MRHHRSQWDVPAPASDHYEAAADAAVVRLPIVDQ